MFFGIALLVAGVLMLLSRADLIPGDFWDYLLPAILIVLGGRMILNRRKT